MLLIELPRALEDYFAFAETEPTRHGRRFSITLPYRQDNKLERLQWWYHVSPAQEQMYDGHGMTVLRTRAIERFRIHIERWLEITRQRLHGDGPIPCLAPLATVAPSDDKPADSPPAATVLPFSLEKAAAG